MQDELQTIKFEHKGMKRKLKRKINYCYINA